MSLSVDGFWKAGFWSQTFWAAGFWYEATPSTLQRDARFVVRGQARDFATPDMSRDFRVRHRARDFTVEAP